MRASLTSPTPTYTSRDPAPSWKPPDGASSLYLGDALDLLAQVPDDSIDCIWTDPPYLLSNDGITCVGGRMVSVNKGDWDRSQGLEADHEFNVTWTAEAYRVLKPTGTIWVSGTLHVYPSVGMALRQNGFRLLNDIVWEKTNPPPNLGRRTFTHSTEVVLWASKAAKGSKHRYVFNYDEDAGRERRQADADSVEVRRRGSGGEEARKAPDAETDCPNRSLLTSKHEPRRT